MKSIFQVMKGSSIIKRIEKLKYTIQHKIAFLKVEKELFGNNTIRGYLHDIDKVFMYILLPLSLNKISKIHRKFSSHHVENKIVKSVKDYEEMIIDWECARFTKKDKPLNAIETMEKYYPKLKNELMPIFNKLKLVC